jgi:hypothetical protein
MVALTPREALIYVSEVVCKPAFGATYFGNMRLRLVDKPGLYIDDSCGFVEELYNLRDIRIIQVMGRGSFGPDDTRTYVTLPNVPTVTIFNTGTEEEYLQAVHRTVEEWLDEHNKQL